MRVLVGCEESQAVCIEFRKLGHEAYSNDILPCSGGHPEWHLQMDVFEAAELIQPDIAVFFPPCTDLAVSGARWFKEKQADGRQQASIDFFMRIVNLPMPKAIENPIGIMSSIYRKPDQIIQPWQFGHGETKATCLWLDRLPPLNPTDIVEGREQRIWKMPPGPNRAMERSKTYAGIAKAMAEQWGSLQVENSVIRQPES